MKLKVTNGTRGLVSLPNGTVLDTGDSILIFISDEAVALVVANGAYADCPKALSADVALYSALLELYDASKITIAAVESSGGGFLSLPFCQFRAGTFPDTCTWTSGQTLPSSGALTAFVATKPGAIINAGFSVASSGEDASNVLKLVLNVLINAVSIFSTKPAVSKSAAGAAANTLKAGYGVTVGVIDPTKSILAVGDVVTFTYTLTRTASPAPTAEISGPVLILEIQ